MRHAHVGPHRLGRSVGSPGLSFQVAPRSGEAEPGVQPLRRCRSPPSPSGDGEGRPAAGRMGWGDPQGRALAQRSDGWWNPKRRAAAPPLRGRRFVDVCSWTPLRERLFRVMAGPGPAIHVFPSRSHRRPASRGRLFVDASSTSWPGLARPSTACLVLAATSRKSWMPAPRAGMTANERAGRREGGTRSCVVSLPRGSGGGCPGAQRRVGEAEAEGGSAASSWTPRRERLVRVMAGPGPAIHDLPFARTSVP
jgi:hypothetical protein